MNKIGHTGRVQKKPLIHLKVWEWGPMIVVVAGRMIREITVGGMKYWRWWEDIGVLLGWVIGSMLADLDDWLYALVSNPQELTSQRVKKELDAKNFTGAWGILQLTKGERSRMPIRNVLTLVTVVVVGIWIVTSNGSPLGSGVVIGLGIRLLGEMLADLGSDQWFWIFSRKFSYNEKMALVLGCVVAFLWEGLMIIRG